MTSFIVILGDLCLPVMCRRLGLVPHQAPNISRTLEVIVDTLNKLQAASQAAVDLKAGEGSSIYGLRSEPPSVPAPPTLAPEPLMLSPLNELPYLFALEAPGSADGLSPADGGSLGGGRGGPQFGKKKTNRVLATKNEKVRNTFRPF